MIMIVGNSKDGGEGMANSQQGHHQTRKEGVLKGILKRPNENHPRAPPSLQGITSGGDNHQWKPRRCQRFPSPTRSSSSTNPSSLTTTTTTNRNKKNRKVDFSPIARMVTIESSKEMSNDEKADIWWQCSDYEEFRKTAKMVAKTMLQGGSEIWLASNPSWQVPNQTRVATLQSAFFLSKPPQQQQQPENKDSATTTTENRMIQKEESRYYSQDNNNTIMTSSKWWCRFGHSRRGLEQLANVREGRQRTTNNQASVRAVVLEYQQQTLFRRQDAEYLRITSLRYTSWARDLAKATGQADADAVRTDFGVSQKTRAFYLRQYSEGNAVNLFCCTTTPSPRRQQ
jgi:hypothetical protein